VIIPSHNRRELLERILGSLQQQQTYPPTDLEIVVCADGCQDDTVTMLKGTQQWPLTVLELPGVGPAGARNAGAEAARSPLLIFLDDDVDPTPGFIEAHVRAHDEHPRSVVLGPYPPLPHASSSLSRLALRRWWTRHFAAMAEPGHRIHYTDVLTGNLSMPKEIWQDIGGLDERLRAHEDYELGIRLIEAGVPIVFASRALGYHYEHETTRLDGYFRRAREEGRAAVLIGEKHPEIRPAMKFVDRRRRSSWKAELAHRIVFSGGPRMDRAARTLERLLAILDHRGLRKLHAGLFRRMKEYWYVRGVSQSMQSFSAWRSLAREPVRAPETSALVIDLRQGVAEAAAVLDAERPQWVELRYGSRRLGQLSYSAGAEPWRGEHLPAHLFAHAGTAYLRAMAEYGAIPTVAPENSQRLAAGITRMARHFGWRRQPFTFGEQHEQWLRAGVLDP
jgi:GT2 family glycosyltransferase